MSKNRRSPDNAPRGKRAEKNPREKRQEKVQRNLLVFGWDINDPVRHRVENEIDLEGSETCIREVDAYYIIKGSRKIRIERISYRGTYNLSGGIRDVTARQINLIMEIL